MSMTDRYLTLAEQWEALARGKRVEAAAGATNAEALRVVAKHLDLAAAELRRMVEQAQQESDDAP